MGSKQRTGDPSADPEFPEKGFPEEALGLLNKLGENFILSFLLLHRLVRRNPLIC